MRCAILCLLPTFCTINAIIVIPQAGAKTCKMCKDVLLWRKYEVWVLVGVYYFVIGM